MVEPSQIPGMLIECSERDIPEDIKIIPLKEFLDDHKKRFILKTSLGSIVLKRITHLDAEEVTLGIAREVPSFFSVSKRAHSLFQVLKAGGELDADSLIDMARMGRELEPYMKRYAMKCFVRPVVESVEELDAIYTKLLPKETEELQVLLKDLSKMRFDGELSNLNVTITKDLGIPMTNEKLALDMMTERQVGAYSQKIEKAEEEARRMMERA